jgi:sugar transferase (PEP-CTERM system associated)
MIVATEITWIVVSLSAIIAVDLASRQVELSRAMVAQQAAGATLLYLAAFYYCDCYDFTGTQLRREIVTLAIRAFSVLAVAFGTLFLWTEWFEFRATTMLAHLVLTTAFVIVLRTRIDALLAHFGIATKVAIVGTGAAARRLGEEIIRRHPSGHEISCFVGDPGDTGVLEFGKPNPGILRVPIIPPSALPEVAREQRLKRILVATADLGDTLPVDDLLRCKTEGYDVADGHTFCERLLGRIFVADLSPQWLIFSDGFVRPARARAVKRVIDVIAATVLLIINAPVCALVALAIKLEDGGPVLFRQRRTGCNDVPFTLYKFRSMRVDAEAATGPKWAENNDPRVTWVGRWIRLLRIDEIPQAWNVLRGDMSFVGPRPERPEFVARLRAAIPYYDQRHAVQPGLTGWAQVNFPYGATVEESRQKLEYDLYYLKNFSVLMDAFIMLRTIKIILFKIGSR